MKTSLVITSWCMLTSAKQRFEILSNDAAFYACIERINKRVCILRTGFVLAVSLVCLVMSCYLPQSFWWMLPLSVLLLVMGLGVLGVMPASQQYQEELQSVWEDVDAACDRQYRYQVWQVEMLLWRSSPQAISALQAQAISEDTASIAGRSTSHRSRL